MRVELFSVTDKLCGAVDVVLVQYMDDRLSVSGNGAATLRGMLERLAPSGHCMDAAGFSLATDAAVFDDCQVLTWDQGLDEALRISYRNKRGRDDSGLP